MVLYHFFSGIIFSFATPLTTCNLLGNKKCTLPPRGRGSSTVHTIFFWHNFSFRVRGASEASAAHAQTYKTLPTQELFNDSISTRFMVNGTVRYRRQVVLVLYHLGSSTVGILAVWYNTSIFSGIIFFSNIIYHTFAYKTLLFNDST